MPEKLQRYLDELRPQRKRESEKQAFEELRADFPVEDIADAFESIIASGLPGGEPCHSPMAYLSVAMTEVMTRVMANRERDRRRQEEAVRTAEESRRRADEAERSCREWEEREAAFIAAFDGQDENAVIADICRRHGFALSAGRIGRMFAISRWAELNDAERRATA